MHFGFGFGLRPPATVGTTPTPPPSGETSFIFAGETTLDSRITFTRSTTGTLTNSSGVLVSAAINAPRFDYNPGTLQALGLLIEEQRTNVIRNNTMQDAVAGTPGTLPTNWAAQINTTTGLTSQIVGVGTDSGISYIDYRISGTASGAGSFNLFFETADSISAFNPQVWTGSLYWKLQAGSTTGLSAAKFQSDEYDGSVAFLGSTSVNLSFPTSAALNTQRVTATYTISDGGTELQRPLIVFNIASGAAIDITLRIGMPQLELGAFATSVIPTASAQVTRTSDLPRITGTNFSSWYNQSVATIYAEGATFSTSTSACAVSIDNNTSGSRIQLRRNSTGPASNLRMSASGSSIDVNFVSGTATGINKIAAATTAADQAAASNGALFTGITSIASMPTVTQMQIGTGPLATFWNGHIRRITYYSSRLSNSELQAITA